MSASGEICVLRSSSIFGDTSVPEENRINQPVLLEKKIDGIAFLMKDISAITICKPVNFPCLVSGEQVSTGALKGLVGKLWKPAYGEPSKSKTFVKLKMFTEQSFDVYLVAAVKAGLGRINVKALGKQVNELLRKCAIESLPEDSDSYAQIQSICDKSVHIDSKDWKFLGPKWTEYLSRHPLPGVYEFYWLAVQFGQNHPANTYPTSTHFEWLDMKKVDRVALHFAFDYSQEGKSLFFNPRVLKMMKGRNDIYKCGLVPGVANVRKYFKEGNIEYMTWYTRVLHYTRRSKFDVFLQGDFVSRISTILDRSFLDSAKETRHRSSDTVMEDGTALDAIRNATKLINDCVGRIEAVVHLDRTTDQYTFASLTCFKDAFDTCQEISQLTIEANDFNISEVFICLETEKFRSRTASIGTAMANTLSRVFQKIKKLRAAVSTKNPFTDVAVIPTVTDCVSAIFAHKIIQMLLQGFCKAPTSILKYLNLYGKDLDNFSAEITSWPFKNLVEVDETPNNYFTPKDGYHKLLPVLSKNYCQIVFNGYVQNLVTILEHCGLLSETYDQSTLDTLVSKILEAFRIQTDYEFGSDLCKRPWKTIWHEEVEKTFNQDLKKMKVTAITADELATLLHDRCSKLLRNGHIASKVSETFRACEWNEVFPKVLAVINARVLSEGKPVLISPGKTTVDMFILLPTNLSAYESEEQMAAGETLADIWFAAIKSFWPEDKRKILKHLKLLYGAHLHKAITKLPPATYTAEEIIKGIRNLPIATDFSPEMFVETFESTLTKQQDQPRTREGKFAQRARSTKNGKEVPEPNFCILKGSIQASRKRRLAAFGSRRLTCRPMINNLP